MKKIYFLLSMFLLTGSLAKAQDTLLFEDFELSRFYDTLLVDCQVAGPPPGNTVDMNWYNMDGDGIAASGSASTRPLGFYASYPASVVDQYETVYGTMAAPDSNTVISANSWTDDGSQQENWLITPSIQLGLADTLFWKSAPLQTPRFLDGYQVLISTTTNDDNTGAFSTVLFNASEMTGTPATDPDTVFADFTFAPTATGGPATFVHGLDGLFMDNAGTTAPISKRGRLRQFSKPLNAYGNQKVFIAFLANTHDDNAITFDDVMIRGTLSTIGVNDKDATDLGLNLFPNPATDNVQVNYTLTSDTDVIINLYDVTGKLVISESKGEQAHGLHFAQINTSNIAKGFYTVKVVTALGQSTSKLIVR